MATLPLISPSVVRASGLACRTVSARTQTRAYAARIRKPSSDVDNIPGGSSGSRKADGASQPQRMYKSPGVFLPMAVDLLQDPILLENRTVDLDIPEFRSEALTRNSVGMAMKFPMNDTDPMCVFGLPKRLVVEFRVLPEPYSVVRNITLDVLDRLNAAGKNSSIESRMVLTGSPGCGKSFTLVQAAQYASSTEWLVFYFPRTIDALNSSTPYAYDARTKIYLQHSYAYETLQRFLTVNETLLQNLKTQNDIPLDGQQTVPKETPLITLITVGTNDRIFAPTILSALMEELGLQNQYPVLLAIDDFHALYCKSWYRDPFFTRINSYHLSMPRLLLEYASGKKTFARGAVLGAFSSHDTAFRIPLELKESLGLSDATKIPYIKRSPELVQYARGLTKIAMPEQMTIKEAASIFDVLIKAKAIHGTANDELFMSKYTESGGNGRDFVWKGLLSTFVTT